MSLKIDGMDIKVKPILPKEMGFDKDKKSLIYVDLSNKRIKKIQIRKSEYKWVYEDGTEYKGKSFPSKDGKAFKGFPSTKVVSKYETIELDNILDFGREELTYLLCNQAFKEKMSELGKALSFTFIAREGCSKGYKAVVFYNKNLKKVIMKCFRVNLNNTKLDDSENENEIEAGSIERESVEQLDI